MAGLLRASALGLLAIGLTTFSLTASSAGLPELGDSSDAVVSAPQERAIGRRIMIEIRGDNAFIDDEELVDYINALGNKLVAASPGATNDNRREFEFFMLNDDSINAFALLGGFVGVHTGLILTTTNESELASVIGHEIAHVLQRHQSRGADEQRKNAPMSLLGLAAAILAARSGSQSSSQGVEAAIVTSQALAYQSQLNYTRDYEREADRLGLQVMQRGGFDPTGMPSFFERMLRANRHNDTGKAPGYLRTHPLTTERIADMQDRVLQMGVDGKRSVPDSIEYKFAMAKLRAMSLGGSEAVSYFKNAIAERTILRNRADVYGLAYAQNQARDFVGAEQTISMLREAGAVGGFSPATSIPTSTTSSNTAILPTSGIKPDEVAYRQPWVANLAAQIQAGQRKWDNAIGIYKTAMRTFPSQRALIHGYINTLYESGKLDAALAAANEELKTTQDDAKLYELAAKIYERKGKKLAQHRAIAEAYFRRDNLRGAIEQLEIAVKAKDGDFYESSGAESRLRELKLQFKNRVMLPGEKRDKNEDRDEKLGFRLSSASNSHSDSAAVASPQIVSG